MLFVEFVVQFVDFFHGPYKGPAAGCGDFVDPPAASCDCLIVGPEQA